MDAVFNYIFSKEERNIDTSIEETHSLNDKGELNLTNKVIKENKNSDRSQHEAVKYEFIRELFNILEETDIDDEIGQPLIDKVGQEIAWNTLFRYGFLKNV